MSFHLIDYKVQGSLCFWKLLLSCSERPKAIKPSGNMQGEGNHLNTVIVLLMEALFKASAVDSAPWFSYQSSLYQREKTLTWSSYWANITLHFRKTLLKICPIFFLLRHAVWHSHFLFKLYRGTKILSLYHHDAL